MRLTALATALLCATLVPITAYAHAALVSATPAQDSSVARPTTIALTFSEPVVGPLSGIELVMTAMPGMANHKPMPIKGFTATIKGKTLTAKLPRPLPSGTYTLTWHAVAADQHRVEGSYAFTVR